MKKKNLRSICILWAVLAILLLISIFMADTLNSDPMKQVISKIVWVYVFGSCIMAGVIAYLRRKTK